MILHNSRSQISREPVLVVLWNYLSQITLNHRTTWDPTFEVFCMGLISGKLKIIISVFNFTFEIVGSHWSIIRQKWHMTGSHFLELLIIHILNLYMQLDNVSLFYNNMHILSQNSHCLCLSCAGNTKLSVKIRQEVWNYIFLKKKKKKKRKKKKSRISRFPTFTLKILDKNLLPCLAGFEH